MPRTPGAPRKRRKVPSYRRHSTGQAFVEIRGRRYYLGKHGTEASHAAYKLKLDELWLKPPAPAPELGIRPGQVDRLTIVDLLFAYRPFAEQHYQKHGKPTGTFANMAPAMRRLRELYGQSLARHFGPLKFQALRQTWIAERKALKTVNEYAAAVRRVFRWAVKNELIPPGVFEGLRAVEGVRPGRSTARDKIPVPPVADDVIDATLPHLPPLVAAMVRLQRLTGCRPAEVCILRRCDINRGDERRSGKREKSRPLFEPDVWEYRPASHKTEHLGHERVIHIGPRAQVILRPYMFGEPTALR
jgi:integrase